MCKFFQIIFWPLSYGNNKGISVEKYHRFLNKTQATTRQYRGSHDVFVQNAKTSQNAWKSAQIDDTYVMRRVAAVGREFRFTLDTELLPTPTLNPDKKTSVV